MASPRKPPLPKSSSISGTDGEFPVTSLAGRRKPQSIRTAADFSLALVSHPVEPKEENGKIAKTLQVNQLQRHGYATATNFFLPRGCAQKNLKTPASWPLDTPGGCFHAELSDQAPVTREGRLIFFFQFLQAGARWQEFLRECPLHYVGNPGNEHAAAKGLPGLREMLDKLPRHQWHTFTRGDCGYGNEGTMLEHEQRGLPYLFKIRHTPKSKISSTG